MKKIDLPMLADVLFYAFCGWFPVFCALRYYRVPFGVSLAVATLFALAVGGIVLLVLGGRSRKRNLSKREKEMKEALMLHLALEKQERVRAQLLTALTADGADAHCEGEELSAFGSPLVPLFTMEPISADEIARLIRTFGKVRFTLACNTVSAEGEKLLSSFGETAMRGDDVFALFQRTGTTPNPLICGELPRKTIKTRLKRSFMKSNARPFFVSGLLLLFMSLFTFFPVYYLVSGSVLLIAAIAVRLFGFAA